MPLDKVVDSARLNADLTTVADAIRTKGGTSAQLSFPIGMAQAVADIPTGGASEGDITFYDYDGTIVESWSLDELQSKTALPDNPDRTADGLTAQGWNWTLADLKAQNTKMNVGQMYKTTSGLTEFDISLNRAIGLTVYCDMAGNKNWGDGTADALYSHTYADYGEYTITCDGTIIPATPISNPSACIAVRIGELVSKLSLLRDFDSLASVTIPSSLTSIGVSAFGYCYTLKSVTIPSGVTSIGVSAFGSCYNIKSVTIPSGVTSIGQSAFGSCYTLKSVTIPSGVTRIGQSAFGSCYTLKSVTIPSGVTSIESNTFSRCYSTVDYDFTSCTAVPTLANTNAFSPLNKQSKIRVPAALEAEWKAATNWSSFANYIYGE